MIVTPGMDFAARLASEQIGRPIRESRAGLLTATALIAVAAVVALVVVAARFWRTTITLACLLYLVVLGGVWVPVQLAAMLAACLVAWRWRWPESFRRLVVPPVRAWLVRWGRYAPRWAMLTSRHGLVVRPTHVGDRTTRPSGSVT